MHAISLKRSGVAEDMMYVRPRPGRVVTTGSARPPVSLLGCLPSTPFLQILRRNVQFLFSLSTSHHLGPGKVNTAVAHLHRICFVVMISFVAFLLTGVSFVR